MGIDPREALIGVDGGASGFRAHEVRVLADGRLSLGAHSAALSVEPVAGFVALPLEAQRASAAASAEEQALCERWLAAASTAIARVAAGLPPAPLRVGICAPGLKTEDGRGIAAALNGPRVPHFAREVERRLEAAGLVLAAPIGPLASDGLACGVGEDRALGGRFADVRDAYYVGGGSGVAESWKLAGVVRAAESFEPALPRAWRLAAEGGGTFEQHLSIARLNQQHAALGAPARPEDAAAAGEPGALRLFADLARRLSELAFVRLAAAHAVHGVVLERIVVGQRLGALFADPRLARAFAEPARAALSVRLESGGSRELRDAWLGGERLVGSDLRAAPAIGALALALSRAHA